MSKHKFIKGNLRRDDFQRAVITDTSPAEVPIIVSNDGLYSNLHNLSKKSKDTQALIERFLDHDRHKYTIPYRFRVTKDAVNTRRLSMIHPRSQLAVAKFYQKYSEIICHYNSISRFSIRAPVKQGSSYFYRSSVSDKNKYKGQGIDTLQFEKRVRNPASFFAYLGHDRQYKFFESARYSRLEKKYRIMWMGDVSKCFDSIYSHTITWAVKDMPFAKTSIGQQSFGNDFDRLMQGMNYNETNGICIGPEVSRIFAETIFQKIDIEVEMHATKLGFIHKKDYECIRYVDDIIIFARNTSTAASVYSIIEKELGKFNLHLNELKLSKLSRPFQTKKSWIIHKLVKKLRTFQEQLTHAIDLPGGKRLAPNHIFRPLSLRLKFIGEIKSVCTEVGVSYDMVSNYIIASLSNRLEDIADAYRDIELEQRPADEDYLKVLLLLLDLLFHFYTMHPTVNSSFRLAKAIVLAIRFVENVMPKRKPYVFERLMQWTTELVRSFEEAPDTLRVERIPIEVINVVLALSEHDDDSSLPSDFLFRTIFSPEKLEYFSTVSLLFFVANKPRYKSFLSDIENQLTDKFRNGLNPDISSHDAHLALDILACPYLAKTKRADYVSEILKNVGLGPMNKKRRLSIVSEIEGDHWFVNWAGIELLNMIKRKELSQVY